MRKDAFYTKQEKIALTKILMTYQVWNSSIVSYYRQISTNIKIEMIKFIPVLLSGALGPSKLTNITWKSYRTSTICNLIIYFAIGCAPKREKKTLFWIV